MTNDIELTTDPYGYRYYFAEAWTLGCYGDAFTLEQVDEDDTRHNIVIDATDIPQLVAALSKMFPTEFAQALERPHD